MKAEWRDVTRNREIGPIDVAQRSVGTRLVREG